MYRIFQNLCLRKYLFFILLLSCVAVIIFLLHAFSSSLPTLTEKNDDDKEDYSQNERSFTFKLPEEMLDENFDSCLKSASAGNDYTHLSTEKWLTEIKYAEKHLRNETPAGEEDEQLQFTTLLKFGELSRILKIETVIIDPFILFCMLSLPLKKLLLKRNFRLESKRRTQYVVTLGILETYVLHLEKKETQEIIKENGFTVEFVKHQKLEWMESQTSDNYNEFPCHIFFKYKKMTLLLVAFYQRSNYLWHSSMTSQHGQSVSSINDLYFAHADSAFDNFTSVSLGFKSRAFKGLNIPSNPSQFLFQMESSRFLECNMTVVETFRNLNTSDLPQDHSRFTIPEFNDILVKALQELKTQLNPLYIRFWIWSGTMLGWYRQCDVIPYTGDVDFGAWSSDVDDLDVILQIFQENKVLHIKQKMGLVNEGLEFYLDCSGLRVDIFFIQPESNGTWYAGHRPSKGYYFKYHHPNFSLCSAELLGNKVLVPCETEDVIAAEYGKEWMQPVSSWYYETSIKNRGPNIYWKKSLLKKVYTDFQ